MASSDQQQEAPQSNVHTITQAQEPQEGVNKNPNGSIFPY
jgi:hypothetical protein